MKTEIAFCPECGNPTNRTSGGLQIGGVTTVGYVKLSKFICVNSNCEHGFFVVSTNSTIIVKHEKS